ncbi:MAG: AarF/ABC1/UbiB kinase family protein [Desulfobacteraceae bacterium]|nr:AarF/ABC1/UbiB kinase family protein [Desulfobacteraceae bacterium]
MLSIKEISGITRKYRHVMRYRQILGIIFRYGFGNIIDALNIEQYIEVGLKLISRTREERVAKLSGNERIRMIFEELGPTFIKLGQIVSTRPDLVPVDLVKELSKLQDKVPPFEFEQVEAIIVSEFGKPCKDVFKKIDEEPLASASIGQVHKAILKNGQGVAVKIQRPGIKKIIEVDLQIMHHLASLMETHIKEIAPHRPVKILEEFAKSLGKELDYSIEAANIQRIADQFKDDNTIHIPIVYTDQSTDKVLTMEYIEGIKISEIDDIDAAGLDRKIITKRGADFIMKQVFENGFFHADPHPGNIFVIDNNVICPIDFGMTGFVTRNVREFFVDLLHSIASGNTRLLTRLLFELTEYDDNRPDFDSLEREIADFIARYASKPLKDIKTGAMINQALEMVAGYGIKVPPDFFLMLKAFVEVEGIAKRLDPDFDIISHTKPYVKAVKLKKFSPSRITENVGEIVRDSLKLIQFFPGDLRELLRTAKQGKMNLNFKIAGLDKILETHDQTSNRIAFAIIIASLIMGSAQLIDSNVPPVFFGVSLIGIVGFIAAAMMGVWLLLAIIKKGRL